MRYASTGLMLLTLIAPALADDSPLAEARRRWLHGNYEEAKTSFERLLKDSSTHNAAALGLSRTLQSQGEYDKALAVIDEALKANATNATLHARRAGLLYLRGRCD